MEDDLKILKVEYLSNHSSDPPQILNLRSGDQTKIKNAWNEDNLQWKTTSNIESAISQQPLIGSSSNFKLKLRGPKQNQKMLQMKTTSDGRRPKHIESGISQQPLVGSYSNFKLKLRGTNQNTILL